MASGGLICQRCLGCLKTGGGSSLAGRNSATRPFRKINSRFPEQRRSLLTAVTSLPPKRKSSVPGPPLYALVDAALLQASTYHIPNDPPSHAIILIHKALIPPGKDQFLDALGESQQLCGLNALVGVVDAVGDRATGISVLLASSSEGVTIDRLQGSKKEEVRVGRWHAQDVETVGEAMNFEDVMASIRGQVTSTRPSVPAVSSKREFVFAIGEMEGTQSQAESISQMFPKADIVSPFLCNH